MYHIIVNSMIIFFSPKTIVCKQYVVVTVVKYQDVLFQSLVCPQAHKIIKFANFETVSHFLLLKYFLKSVFMCSFSAMDQVMQFVEPAKQFSKDSLRLVKRCTKPDRKGKIKLIYLSFSLHLPYV